MKQRFWAKVVVVAVVVVAIVVAWRFGSFALLAEPKALARTVVKMGVWGYLVFVLAYAAVQPFGVPGTVFVVAASLIWPWPAAFALSMVGTMAASVVGFSFARFVAKDWISKRIPARLRKYDAALERNAFQTVLVLRLLFWMPPLLHAFFGVSKVRFSTHVWGSFLGYIPPLLAISYFGSRIFDASGRLQPDAWPVLAGLVAFAALVALLTRAWNRFSAGAGSTP